MDLHGNCVPLRGSLISTLAVLEGHGAGWEGEKKVNQMKGGKKFLKFSSLPPPLPRFSTPFQTFSLLSLASPFSIQTNTRGHLLTSFTCIGRGRGR